MAARYTKHQTEACRAKIKTTQLINRLQRHIAGKLDLSPTQVRGIEILLNKTLANLQQAEHTVEVKSYVARLPEPAQDAATWLASVDVPQLISPPLAHDHESLDNQGHVSDQQSDLDDKAEGE
jgi:hypothetical protein